MTYIESLICFFSPALSFNGKCVRVFTPSPHQAGPPCPRSNRKLFFAPPKWLKQILVPKARPTPPFEPPFFLIQASLGHGQWGVQQAVAFQSRLSVCVNRNKIIMRTVWTDPKNYVNRCEPAWKFMRTNVNRKHTLLSISLKNIYVCESVWTDRKYFVNRRGKLCEPVRTGVKIYVARCEPKTYSCECHPKKYVNRCEPAENIMWTGVNRGSH